VPLQICLALEMESRNITPSNKYNRKSLVNTLLVPHIDANCWETHCFKLRVPPFLIGWTFRFKTRQLSYSSFKILLSKTFQTTTCFSFVSVVDDVASDTGVLMTRHAQIPKERGRGKIA